MDKSLIKWVMATNDEERRTHPAAYCIIKDENGSHAVIIISLATMEMSNQRWVYQVFPLIPYHSKLYAVHVIKIAKGYLLMRFDDALDEINLRLCNSTSECLDDNKTSFIYDGDPNLRVITEVYPDFAEIEFRGEKSLIEFADAKPGHYCVETTMIKSKGQNVSCILRAIPE